MTLIWFIVFTVLCIFELGTVKLVTIWFALGSLGALLTSIKSESIWLQILVFILVSVLAYIVANLLERIFGTTTKKIVRKKKEQKKD